MYGSTCALKSVPPGSSSCASTSKSPPVLPSTTSLMQPQPQSERRCSFFCLYGGEKKQPGEHGCGSNIPKLHQKVNGTKDYHLRNPSSLTLSHTHMSSYLPACPLLHALNVLNSNRRCLACVGTLGISSFLQRNRSKTWKHGATGYVVHIRLFLVCALASLLPQESPLNFDRDQASVACWARSCNGLIQEWMY